MIFAKQEATYKSFVENANQVVTFSNIGSAGPAGWVQFIETTGSKKKQRFEQTVDGLGLFQCFQVRFCYIAAVFHSVIDSNSLTAYDNGHL